MIWTWVMRLGGPALKWGALALAGYLASGWVIERFEAAGRNEAVTEQMTAAVDVLRSEIEELRARREELDAALAERDARYDALRTSFDVLRDETREVRDACTAVALPDAYTDGLLHATGAGGG